MIHPGDRLENPVTGEVLVFHQTSEQTGGELVRVETIVRPDGFVAAAHVHPAQTERFEVLDGTVGFRLGRKTFMAGPGDVTFVPFGTPHRFWNAGPGEARFVCEIRPALRFESLIETMFTLAAQGKTNQQGLPGPLQLAVIADAHFEHGSAAVSACAGSAGRARGRGAARQDARLPGDDSPPAPGAPHGNRPHLRPRPAAFPAGAWAGTLRSQSSQVQAGSGSSPSPGPVFGAPTAITSAPSGPPLMPRITCGGTRTALHGRSSISSSPTFISAEPLTST